MSILEDRVSPMGMWRWGNDFITDALKIQPMPTSKVEEANQIPSITAYYLIAHGIELQLKAFLMSNGVKIEELKSFKKYGHNLNKLISEAKIKNIDTHVSLSEYDIAVISLLNDTYKEKELEYFLSGGKSLPIYSELCELTQRISAGLHDTIHKSY